MLYIRRIFHQDVTHQMTADRDGSKLFFKYDYTERPNDRDIVFKFINYSEFDEYDGQKVKGILHPDSSESRINGEFKSFVFSSLEAAEKDFLLIWNYDRDNSYYTFTLINSKHPMYKSLEMMVGNKNHLLCCIPEIDEKSSKLNSLSLQKIVYGAPGTGKSFGTDDEIHKIYPEGSEEEKKYVFRTTFHPDSDYSTFVGCYKPTKVVPMRDRYSIAELKLLYQEFKRTCDARPEIQFAGRYFTSIEPLSKEERMVVFVGSEENVVKSEVPKAIYAARAYAEACEKSSASITYAFTPQAFTKAYIAAWESVLKGENKDVFLVVEEINRGNCAQIFGDLFQLLDRKENGRSRYPIKPDTDLGNYINEQLGKIVDDEHEDIAIARGEEMVLPENLHIWATMNTSDQSLFPIDSAFKRRWDWKYVPIDYDKEDWSIAVNGWLYSWSEFLEKINDLVASVTESEDKKLGFYFAKAKDGIIDADTFVGKVIFYLWNDVFKDYGLPKELLNGADSKEFAFRNFFNIDGSANQDLVEKLLDNLEVGADKDDRAEEDENKVIDENKLSTGARQRYDYWNAFLKYANDNNAEYKKYFGGRKTPSTEAWYNFSFGFSDCYLSVCRTRSRSELAISLYFDETNEKYYKLAERINDIEKDLNITFVCDEKPGKKSSAIVETTPLVNFDDETDWPRQFDFIIDRLLRMREVFTKYLNM